MASGDSQTMQTAAKLGQHRYSIQFIVLIFFWTFCRAALVNRTIDDTFGDSVTGFKPIYNPSSGRWVDQTCSTCDIQPNSSLAYDGTWAAATYTPPMKNVSITLQFTGVAIWVFFILANANQNGTNVTTKTHCNFTLDGLHVGSYLHNPDISTFDLVYNATAFSTTGLTNTAHQLIIMTNDWPFNVYLNFDYAIYTTSTDSSNSTPSSSSNPSRNNERNSPTSTVVAPIVGGVVGAVVGITVACLVFLFLRIRTSRKSSASITPASAVNPTLSEHIEPFRNTSAGTATIPSLSIREKGHMNFSSDNRDELRAIRQTEIDRQLHSVRREMEDLTARQPNVGGSQSEAGQETQDLREQVRSLTAQIEHLQRERQSDWALGLSDGPPPAYVR